MKRLLGRRGVAVAFVVVVAIAVAGIAYASIPDANGVIHGCYAKTTGKLRVIDSGGNGCTSGENPLDWSQTGPTGTTGSTGATGATGPTGPTGALSSAYLDAYEPALEVVPAGNAVVFDSVVNASGITLGPGGTFTVAASGVYQVTVDLQGFSLIPIAQLSVNGLGVGPSLQLDCSALACTFTRLLSVHAGDVIRLVNNPPFPGQVDTGSGITIVRIA
jgi:hypothetical protein